MKPLATIKPLEEAVKHFGEKSVVASQLRTAGWERVPAEIADRSFFSAGVEDARFLTAAQEKIMNALKLQREAVAKGEALVNRSSFIGDLRKLALPLSESDNPFADQGVTNIASRARLGLIYDMQTQMAQGFAGHKMDTRPEVLDAYPAQRLVRVEPRKAQRDWRGLWDEAGRKVNWQGALKDRLVALKTSPIWAALSDFGTPWSPLKWGTGMDFEDVSRDEAESYGLIAKGETVPPPAQTYFNEGLAAGVQDVGARFVKALTKAFGDRVQVADGTFKWVGNS